MFKTATIDFSFEQTNEWKLKRTFHSWQINTEAIWSLYLLNFNLQLYTNMW